MTGLRIVAAVWVVVFHFHFTALPGVADVVGVFGPLITAGALGVDLFFVLSGFVIAYTYLEQLGPRLRARDTGRFVWARACRIWPTYVLVFNLFGIWLVARSVFGSDPDIAFQGVQPRLGFGEWLQQMVMVQLWDQPFFDGASWVGSTWSISAEWLAYVLFPVAALVLYRMRNLPAGVLALGALGLMMPIAMAYLTTGSPYYPWSWAVRILGGFGAGALTYLVVRRLRSPGGGHGAGLRRAASWIGTGTPVLIVVGLLAGELAGPGRGGVVIVLFPLLVGSLALAESPDGKQRGLARLLSTDRMVHGGRISYALYLVHIPMFEVFWLALRRFGGYDGVSVLAADTLLAHVVGLLVLVATVPVAHLLFVGVEEPARRRLRVLGSIPRRAGSPSPVPPAAESGRLVGEAVPAVAHSAVSGHALPVGNDEARQDPETRALPVVRPVARVRNEEARRDPETRGIPVARPAVSPRPVPPRPAPQPVAAGPVPVVPGQQRGEAPVPVPAAAPAASCDDAPTGEPDVAAGAVGRAVTARRAGIAPRTSLAADLVTAASAGGGGGATRGRAGKHRPAPGRGNRGWIDSPQFGAPHTP
ncbi:MAG: acyltransferase [Pseudonocardia sp.]|nr:acyltransferase [Pseudonocardia sp.]